MTPPEINRVQKSSSLPNDWLVRVVPNKFPVLGIEGEHDSDFNGLYNREHVYPKIRAVYKLFGAEDKIQQFVQPGGHERLLDSVGGQLVAAQDEPRGSMEPIEGIRSECREGVMVAVPGAKDEVSLHRTSGSWRPCRWRDRSPAA